MTPQYLTIIDGAVAVDVSTRGRLEFTGPDAASFLHALVTNDVEGLAPGRGCYAAWLTPQGRMITDLRLFRTEEGVSAEVPAGMGAELAARFDQLIFAEDVRVSDVTDSTGATLVFGGQAAETVARTVGGDAARVAALPMLGHMTVGDVCIARVDDTDLPTFMAWQKKPSGGFSTSRHEEKPPDGFFAELLEALRIKAGRPKFGVDMTTETIPLEAGLLDRAISQTKGCYVGQEVIIRILHRGGGRVAKRLVTMVCDEGVSTAPSPGTTLQVDDRDAGTVTSAATDPDTGRAIALGYVHRDNAVVGGRVRLASGGAAEITALAG
jgi:folate-binding protein YgfZ